MSKKVIGMIVAAVILIAVVVSLVAFNLVDWSKENAEETKGAKEVVINLEEVNEKIAEMEPFNEMAAMDVDDMVLTDYFQIEEDLVKDFVGKIPMMNVHASMYLIIEAEEGKAEDVKDDLELFGKALEQTWENYLPEQYELVKDRKLGVQGNFVYLIVAETADDIEALLK